MPVASSLFSRQAEAFQSPALRQITIEVEKVKGINLGQGVCQLPVPEFIIDQVTAATRAGINRYTNPRGLLSLRQAIAKKLAHFNDIAGLDPETEVLVTCGVTGAFEGVCSALLNPGDEVVVFEPSYPYHIQALKRYGVVIKYVALSGTDWSFDSAELRQAITEKTKFVLVNTPGNPTGKVFSAQELELIGQCLQPHNGLIVSDEIYEYMAFGGRHVSPASLPTLRGRVITMGGYSKTFSITGWRIGYCVAPAEIANVITSSIDAIYACAPAPLQEAVAQGIEHFDDDFYEQLRLKYLAKRNLFVEGLRSIGMSPQVPAGAYYLISSYEAIAPGIESTDFAREMIVKTGVGSVPSSDFVRDPSQSPWVRFCLALEDDILEQALERMRKLTDQR